MKRIWDIIKELWQDFLHNPAFYLRYLVCGACATALNTWVYALLFQRLSFPNVISVALAWAVSTTAGFFGYRLWVFRSEIDERKGIRKQFFSFVGLRVFSFLLEVGVMALAVDVLHGPPILWKVITCCISIVINFWISKFYIFKEKSRR